MANITKTDWIPRYLDAGYGELISSLALQNLSETEMVVEVNSAGSLPDINEAMLYGLISEWQQDDPSIVVIGATLPQPENRPPHVTGINQDGTGIWFSEPDTNQGNTDTLVRWYVNGTMRQEVRLDVTSNRYMTKAQLQLIPTDAVQIAIIGETGVVGRWGRIQVS